MFKFLNNLIKFLIFVCLGGLVYITFSDFFLYTTYYQDFLLEFQNYQDYLIYIGFIALAYMIIVVFSMIEKLFKKDKVVRSKGSNGEVEVSLDTINDISRKFLESKVVVKNAKVESESRGFKVNIYANVETFNTENLNEKISVLQNELREYIALMTGVVVKNVNIKIVKINSETIIEASELDDTPLNSVTDEEIELDSEQI